MCWNKLGWWRTQTPWKQSLWSMCGGHIFVRTRSIRSQSTEIRGILRLLEILFVCSKSLQPVFISIYCLSWDLQSCSSTLPGCFHFTIFWPNLEMGTVWHLACLCRTWVWTGWLREDQLSWTSSRWNPVHKSRLWAWKCSWTQFLIKLSCTHHGLFSAVFSKAKFFIVETKPFLVITSSSSWT